MDWAALELWLKLRCSASPHTGWLRKPGHVQWQMFARIMPGRQYIPLTRAMGFSTFHKFFLSPTAWKFALLFITFIGTTLFMGAVHWEAGDGHTIRSCDEWNSRWLKDNQHIRYMWIPYTDTVVVVSNNRCKGPSTLSKWLPVWPGGGYSSVRAAVPDDVR